MHGQNLHPVLCKRGVILPGAYFEVRCKGCTAAAGEWLMRCVQLGVHQQHVLVRVTDDRQLDARTGFRSGLLLLAEKSNTQWITTVWSCQTVGHMPSGRQIGQNLGWTRSQAAAVEMRDCSAIMRDTAVGARPSVRFVNSRQLVMQSKSASIQSPVFT
jgi:hypothetical protein